MKGLLSVYFLCHISYVRPPLVEQIGKSYTLEKGEIIRWQRNLHITLRI